MRFFIFSAVFSNFASLNNIIAVRIICLDSIHQ